MFYSGFKCYGLFFVDQNDVGIGNPVWRVKDDLVAGVDDGKHKIEETLLAAARNQDLPGSVGKIILPLELGDNGVFEARGAAYRCVFGETLVDGDNGRILDILWRFKIRFPGPQPDDVLALRLELGGPGCDGKGRGGFDGLNSF